MKTNKKIILTWDDVMRDLRRYAKQDGHIKVKNIYGIPRGGLVIATILSHMLDKPLIIDDLHISSETLVVDDISDSGLTFRRALLSFPKPRFPKTFSPWIMAETKFTPSIFWHVKKKNEWIVFPWETLESSKLDRNKHGNKDA